MAKKKDQDFEMTAGDVRNLRIRLEDADGEPAELTTPTATWFIAVDLSLEERKNPKLSKASGGSGIVLVQENEDGKTWWMAYVALTEVDTRDIPGVYVHQLRVTDGSQKEVVTQGKATIEAMIGP